MDFKAMSRNALTTVKVEGTEAVWRTAANQAVMAVREPLIAALRRKGVSETVLGSVGEFLQTEIGMAAIALLLGTALSNIPSFGNNPKVAKLSSEMRIQGMATAGNLLAEMVTGPMRGIMTDLIQGIPEVEELPEDTSVSEKSKSVGEASR